jgi:protein-L-isoaspartate(D-aspartate) O-methyltransferase
MFRQLLVAVIALIAINAGVNSAGAADYAEQRLDLMREVERDARRTAAYTGRRQFDPAVTAAMARIERHRFVPEALARYAYRNRPLPIGFGQTISQPYIVALMTDLLDPKPGQVVLEIGTGSGYQAAVLAELGLTVYTMEIIEPLAKSAKARLKSLGYDKVRVRWGDGYSGWPDHAPFDAIIVTAAGDHIPPPLIAQLRPGGRMVIPVGARFMTQQLVLVKKDATGKVTTRQLLPVAFVPLTRTP